MSNLKIIAILFCSFLTGCAATLVKTEPDSRTQTISYETGTQLDDHAYEKQFQRGATKVCQGAGYEILERSRQPSTLSDMALPPSQFYWVIRCGSPTGN